MKINLDKRENMMYICIEKIKQKMSVQRISVESKLFKRVDRLYPGTQVAILEAWKEGKGWVPFIDVYKTIPGYIVLMTSVIAFLQESGYTTLQLELSRKNKVVAKADYRISELN